MSAKKRPESLRRRQRLHAQAQRDAMLIAVRASRNSSGGLAEKFLAAADERERRILRGGAS